jgi:hypothetical protein
MTNSSNRVPGGSSWLGAVSRVIRAISIIQTMVRNKSFQWRVRMSSGESTGVETTFLPLRLRTIVVKENLSVP